MADYGTSDTSTTSLGANQFPISEVYVPSGAQTPAAGGALTALEGGPASTDSASPAKRSAPASIYIKDGNNVTAGALADAASTDATQTNKSRMSFLKGLVKMVADVWDSGSHRLKVDGSGVTQPISGVVSLSVGTALADWSSQPTQTVAASADTLLKFGTGGTTPFTHIVVQNNSALNFIYAFDQDSTGVHAKIYVLAAGQVGAWDRTASVLHCNTPSQVTFGGAGGITVEAFA